MFREMRRKRQQLSQKQAIKIMQNGITGVLGVLGDDGYPYTVPVNYVYAEEKIYIHCAKVGHKLDAICGHNKVSFCVVESEDVVPEEFTTYFRSVIAFGRAAEVTMDNEKRAAMRLLNRKYAPGLDAAGEEAVENAWNHLCVIRIAVLHLTGKEAKELRK